MSENEATRDDGAEHRLLGVALTDLADSKLDDPNRVDGVHVKARRLRTRRRAARVTAGVVAGAAVIATLVAVRPGPAHVSTLPASQPSTTIAEPSCAAALAAASTQAVVPPTPGATASTASDTPKQAPSDQAATGLRGIKGQGTIVSATASTVTITPDPQPPNPPGLPAQITATVSPTTEFRDGDTKVDALPPLSPGDRVAFGATQAADGSYQLDILVVHVPPPPTGTADTVDPAVKAANAAAGEQYKGIKGLGTIVSATASTVTITPDPQPPNPPGLPAQITATVSPTTEFRDGDTKVDALPPLSPGDRVAFGATQAADGSYQLDILVVHVPPPPTGTADTVDPAVKAANPATGQPSVKASAEVVSVQADSLTIRITDGDRADQVVTAALGPNTMYLAGDQKCVDPVFTAGQPVGVVLAQDASGAYTAAAVALTRPPASRAATP